MEQSERARILPASPKSADRFWRNVGRFLTVMYDGMQRARKVMKFDASPMRGISDEVIHLQQKCWWKLDGDLLIA